MRARTIVQVHGTGRGGLDNESGQRVARSKRARPYRCRLLDARLRDCETIGRGTIGRSRAHSAKCTLFARVKSTLIFDVNA